MTPDKFRREREGGLDYFVGLASPEPLSHIPELAVPEGTQWKGERAKYGLWSMVIRLLCHGDPYKGGGRGCNHL